MGLWYKQLRLLLWKNFLIQSRRKWSAIFEIMLPIFFVLILLILRITTFKIHPTDHHGQVIWNPFQLNRTIPLDKNQQDDFNSADMTTDGYNNNNNSNNQHIFLKNITGWTIAYAPSNNQTDKIMSYLKLFLDADVKGFPSASQMVRTVVTDEENTINAQTYLCGVTFTGQTEFDIRFPTKARGTFGSKSLQKFIDLVPQKWYTMIFLFVGDMLLFPFFADTPFYICTFSLSHQRYTQFIYPISFTGNNPRNEDKDIGGPPPYFHEGFLSVQYAVSMAIIKTEAPAKFNESLFDIQLQR